MKNSPTPHESSHRLAALQAIAPFDRIRRSELSLLAGVLTAHSYAPGTEIHRGGRPLAQLLLVTDGAVEDATGKPIGPIIGLGSLLVDQPITALTASSATGAEILFINRPTFFTLARECPELLRGFLEIGPDGRRLPAEAR